VSEDDLAALCARATRRLSDAELPLLREHDLSMWQYIALTALARAPAHSQLELAQAIRYDKTRLIGLLDELEAAGLVARERDPRDRRARLVSLTAAGAERHAAAQRAIRAMETQRLASLTPGERALLRSALATLAGAVAP
jgi:DNA-binding MarR family transcriptional regulator